MVPGTRDRCRMLQTAASQPCLKDSTPNRLVGAVGKSGHAVMSDLDLVRLCHPEEVDLQSLSPGRRQRDAMHRAKLEAATTARAEADARRAARWMSRPASAPPPPSPSRVADSSAAAAKSTVVLHMPTAAPPPHSSTTITATGKPAVVLYPPLAAPPLQPHRRPPVTSLVEQSSAHAAVVATTATTAAAATRPPMAQAKGVVYTMATPRPMAAHANRAALVVRRGGSTEANAALAYLSRARAKASTKSPAKPDANGSFWPTTRLSTSPLASVQTLSLAASTPNAMRVVASNVATSTATSTATAAAAAATANDATPQPPSKSPYRSRPASPPRPPSPPQPLHLAPSVSASVSRSPSPVSLSVPARRPTSASALAPRSAAAGPFGAARAAARVEAMGSIWLGTSVQSTLSPVR